MFVVFSPLLNEPLGLFHTVEEAETWIENDWSEDDAVIDTADSTEVMHNRLQTYGL